MFPTGENMDILRDLKHYKWVFFPFYLQVLKSEKSNGSQSLLLISARWEYGAWCESQQTCWSNPEPLPISGFRLPLAAGVPWGEGRGLVLSAGSSLPRGTISDLSRTSPNYQSDSEFTATGEVSPGTAEGLFTYTGWTPLHTEGNSNSGQEAIFPYVSN